MTQFSLDRGGNEGSSASQQSMATRMNPADGKDATAMADADADAAEADAEAGIIRNHSL